MMLITPCMLSLYHICSIQSNTYYLGFSVLFFFVSDGINDVLKSYNLILQTLTQVGFIHMQIKN